MAIPTLKSIGTITFRLVGVLAGAKIVKFIYSSPEINVGDFTFSFYWKRNAREALFGVGILALLYYVLEGRSVSINGFGVLAASGLLALFVTAETILMHKDETFDAIESMPGPFVLKVVVGLGALLLTAAISIYYVIYALHAAW